jgi:peptide/nickel transport system substrate-binding protein/oligopeptide transport system substrate-binding protein
MLKRAAAFALCALVACAAGFAADAAPGAAGRELVVADAPETLSLDPLHTYTTFESQFYTAIYEGLVVADPLTLQPLPGVARTWQSPDNGKTWIFTLRPDALYSNGDRLRAQDFVSTWLRMLSPANNAENSYLFDVIKGARAYRMGQQKDPSTVGIRAVSDDTLRVELDSPAPHFLKMLTHIAFLPLHPSLVRSTDWNEASTVIGNGPYVLASRSDAEILLSKNPRYWDAANVEIDRIRIRFMDDKTAATDGYIMGRIQWVTEPSLINFDALTASDKLEAYPLFATTYFYLVSDRTPWNDWRVRRALALLVPWDKVRSKDLFYYPSAQLVPTVPGYPIADGIAGQNVDEAKKLLADAGFPGGKGLPTLVVKLQKGSGMMDLVTIMAGSWKSQIGLNIAVNEVDPAKYLAEARKSDYTLGISTWIGDYADPLTFLQMWTTGSNLNDARFSDKDFDAAVNDSMSITDTTKRYQKLGDAEQILLSHAAILPIDHRPAINLIDTDNIGGWYSNPLDVHPFKFLYYKTRVTPPGIALLPQKLGIVAVR